MKKLFERNLIIIYITALSFVFITSCFPPCDSDLLGKIKLPDGFTICFYADNIPGARSLALGENGTLFVSTRGEGDVYAVTDNNGDYVADEIILIDSGLD
ncbi:MAG: sorbosone dehydrogenase family protein, partial [Deltaproteobacteria bacterium]|nr:sorbosone dehydrogenase family protein [Deltaproteobacteria bacterium]